jgi:hypothetical protein
MNIELDKMIADCHADIEALESALDRHAKGCSLVSHSWVVTMPGLGCMTYELERERSGKYRATGARYGGIACRASRYTREDAKKLAADTHNGADMYGTAMHWTDAARAEIEQNRNNVKLFKELKAKHATV